jgi:hypothetical protein
MGSNLNPGKSGGRRMLGCSSGRSRGNAACFRKSCLFHAGEIGLDIKVLSAVLDSYEDHTVFPTRSTCLKVTSLPFIQDGVDYVVRPSRSSPLLHMFFIDIWLGDNLGESLAFAQDVNISGWTNVGDSKRGAYVGMWICRLFLLEAMFIAALKN